MVQSKIFRTTKNGKEVAYLLPVLPLTLPICFVCLAISVFASELPTAADALKIGERIRASWPRERPLDEAGLQENGVRRLDGKHIRLYTDLPASESVDELPAVFDLMVPMVCEYFELDPKTADSFIVEAFLIEDEDKFKRGGAVWQVPHLRNGYALRCRIWLRNQSSDYYRRHLLLHEGIHALMGWAFGVWGPPWYREGTAEVLSTHHWQEDTLTLAYFPKEKSELRGWGRIEHIQGAVGRNVYRSPRGIYELASEDYDANEAYAWSWAFAAFCEGHPEYRRPFRRIAWNLHGNAADLPERFLDRLRQEQGGQGRAVKKIVARYENDWFDYLKNLDYHYDFERTRLGELPESKPIPPGQTVTVEVRADRGWQASGYHFESGRRYRITAAGRFQLGREPGVWWSEPDGITIRYCNALPMGRLLMTQVPDQSLENPEKTPGIGFFMPRSVGADCEFTAESAAPVYFRINDFAGELEDNQGTATVKIEAK